MTDKPTFPTADQIATAIVVACIETNEDPLVVHEARKPQSRARHYAIQALRHCFPKAQGVALAKLCGCAGNPAYYIINSNSGMNRFQGGQYKGERQHRFWKEDVFQRVIAAVEALAPVDVPSFLEADSDGTEMPPDVAKVFAGAARLQAEQRGKVSVPARSGAGREAEQEGGEG